MTEILAIIPARGGSRGLPRKNLKLFCGVPLVGLTVWQATQAKCVTRVVVSTDDAEIARISRSFGAQIVPRPDSLAGDSASSESALEHCLERLRVERKYEPDLVVFLQCTSPLRRLDDIDRAVATLLNEEADSLLSVVPFHRFIWTEESGIPKALNYDVSQRPRRQDRSQEYMENGSIYIFKPWVLEVFNNRLGGKISLYVMDPSTGCEIDDPSDFRMAQWIAKQTNIPLPLQMLLRRVRLLALDFDGVLTDDRIIVLQDGHEAVICYRTDRSGLESLKNLGFETILISEDEDSPATAWSSRLGIPRVTSLGDKRACLESYCRDRDISMSQVAYVGEDIEVMKAVGLAVAVADALPPVLEAAHVVLRQEGGKGAIREISEMLESSTAKEGSLPVIAP